MARTAKIPLRERLVRAWPGAASALLLLLAFPPFNLGLLTFVALVPWLISLRTVSGKEAWRSGYGFGFLYGLGQLFWIAQLAGHWIDSPVLGFIPWILAAAIFAIYFGWTAVLIRHAWQRDWPWAIPLLWAGIEVVRSYLPIVAFPWGIVATPLWPYTALIQSARFGAIYFVSAWVILANVIVAMLVAGTEYRKVRLPISVFAAVAALSVMVLGIDVESHPVPVTVGQPGVDMAFASPEDQLDGLQANVTRIAANAAADGSKLLVLPEGIATAPMMPPKTVFTLPPNLPVLFGGRRGTGPMYQSAFGFDGRRWQYSDKTRLMIFGEFVPGRDLFPFIAQAFKLPAGDISAGKDGVRALDMGVLKAGPMVCFEGLFPEIAYRQSMNGAQMLAVISIDDWFMDGSAPDQLRAGAVWRAVETGLPTVRAASLGYSLACDGHGRILAAAPLRESRGMRVELPIPTQSPTFKGAIVFPIATGLFALAMPWLRRRDKNVTS